MDFRYTIWGADSAPHIVYVSYLLLDQETETLYLEIGKIYTSDSEGV